jgi:hypothetical protein
MIRFRYSSTNPNVSNPFHYYQYGERVVHLDST